ncbi:MULTISPECIES: hypothetical protein [Clostridia]|uniref:Uncharacterized protein n=1 Tax=Ruminococcus difficilis TaxID=2763069 RepID=A0A934WRJ2_9FIRM|nr:MULTISPECIES: hypothetical protein [Clostridia]MBK6088432.1 hypothetical protein [Ruminococcus difficilis]MBU5461830.1 hypothetical protein [Lachnoclostridium sp. MSJ-17]SCX27011.1 hypothetical protein SAMN02910436_02191 [Ruminococcaceae bacterium P7]
MTKQEVKRFLKAHRNQEYSAAKFEYSMYLYKDIEEKMNEFVAKTVPGKEPEKAANLQMIAEAKTAEDIVKLMRKEALIGNRFELVQKALETEEETLPLIQKRALTNRQDVFIENTVKFFLHCKTNCCDWILDNYQLFKSEYLKSMLCLVLGFRGNVSMIEFLIKEAERLEREYPKESYDQGPTLAVQELSVRFLN